MDRIQARKNYDTVSPYPDCPDPLDTQNLWRVTDPTIPSGGWDPDEELVQMLHTAAPGVDPDPPPLDDCGHPRRPLHRRRPRPGVHLLAGNPRIIPVAILIVMIAACAVTMLTWSISYSYEQLRAIALLVVTADLAQWWPLTVYGPWLLAGLSILRASVQHRTARRSWAVMLISSGTAAALCIGQSPHSLLAMVIVGIPPITALVCFRELVGQFSAKHGPRHAADTLTVPKQRRP
ncbi:DUF2637 domain-containing protein [Streptomyces capitiformicae]|uniref:DUF2637 domain-containing protein n=1 Tax=Streptomyces capitiformicae TaxID=2014920 RepID=A0A919DFN1_9ACTN|nr:DUF2637 domain-containing protein [Streptomyces capitiformicae]GHE39098.1 hypothetical protein GCM10017771_57750 [Streptomyces capitiformicae]